MAVVQGLAGEWRRASGWGGPRSAGNAAVKMPTTGLYKMGDGSNSATNCFLARNTLRTRGFKMMNFSVGLKHNAECSYFEKGTFGGPHAHHTISSAWACHHARVWVLAHRDTPRAWTEKGTTGETAQQRRKPPHSASVEENDEDNILGEPFPMKPHCLKNPSDLCSVNISGQNLVSAKDDDFEKFDCVVFINAAENLLTLELFQKFPGLRELELPLNGLGNLQITAGDFLHLEDLDLSYNNLSPQDIWTLGDLSQLKVLRLTASGFGSLPLDSAHLRFPSQEVLSLDDNRLSDPSVFVSLSHLRSLRELNLDRNGISAVPYLHQAESRQFFLHPTLDGDSFRAEWSKSLSSLWQQSRPPRQEGTEVPAELEAKTGQLGYVVLQGSRQEGTLVPERYKGCEELLGGDTDADFTEPVGTQKNAQALYDILQHAPDYRDAKPPDRVQKPYVPQKKHGRVPGPPARKTKAEILEGILMAMRRNTLAITEVPSAMSLLRSQSLLLTARRRQGQDLNIKSSRGSESNFPESVASLADTVLLSSTNPSPSSATRSAIS
ncbi:LOW QUALITY PROTEIN: X-ray radiation resistance-associated protein 1 [Cariama cristata]